MLETCAVNYCNLAEISPEPPFVLLYTGKTSIQLHSGFNPDAVSANHRWSILGWDPWWSWAPVSSSEPLTDLNQILSQLCQSVTGFTKFSEETIVGDCTDSSPTIPLIMGAWSYDLGRTIETIPQVARDPWHGAQSILYAFRRYLIMDEIDRRGWSVSVSPDNSLPDCMNSNQGSWPMEGFALADDIAPYSAESPGILLRSNFSRHRYLSTVANIREMIAAGDCYQVNLSQQFVVRTDRTARDLWRVFIHKNPAPMMALVDTGKVQVVSSSPERLLRWRAGWLLTEPIKGTIPCASDRAMDREHQQELWNSAKNRAELAMIVDLLRNDLGKVAIPGSVQVRDPLRLESYSNVHHLVATIVARARGTLSWGEVFRAVFPGGSITGCPKLQAMRVIESLEGVRRGFYCGSIGYVGFGGDGDWNLAIRTVTMSQGTGVFNLGGGIVFDSDPELEYEETISKGATIFEGLGCSPDQSG